MKTDSFFDSESIQNRKFKKKSIFLVKSKNKIVFLSLMAVQKEKQIQTVMNNRMFLHIRNIAGRSGQSLITLSTCA